MSSISHRPHPHQRKHDELLELAETVIRHASRIADKQDESLVGMRLSGRTSNALARGNVFDLSDLAAIRPRKLLAIHGMGKRSLSEIALTLSNDSGRVTRTRKSAAPRSGRVTTEQKTAPVLGPEYEPGEEHRENRAHAMAILEQDWMSSQSMVGRRIIAEAIIRLSQTMSPDVRHLDLEALTEGRTHRLVKEHRLHDRENLAAMTPEALGDLPGMGMKSLLLLLRAMIDHPYRAVRGLVPASEYGVSRVHREPPSVHDMKALLDVVEEGLDAMANLAKANGLSCARWLDILRLRFGGQTLDEVGKRFDLTRERIRQIQKRETPNLKRFWLSVSASAAGMNGGAVSEASLDALWRLGGIAGVLDDLFGNRMAQEVEAWSAFLVVRDGRLPKGRLDMLVEVLRAILPSRYEEITIEPVTYARRVRLVVPALPGREIKGEHIEDLVSQFSYCSRQEVREGIAFDPAMLPLPAAAKWVVAHQAVSNWLSVDKVGGVIPPEKGRMTVIFHRLAPLIREATRPFRGEEIANQAGLELPSRRKMVRVDYWLDRVDERIRVEEPLVRPVKIGKGYFATAQMFGLSIHDIERLSNWLAGILSRDPDRQFSSFELNQRMDEAGLIMWEDRWPELPSRIMTSNVPHLILMVARHPKTRYFGRFIWGFGPWTDDADVENRVHVTQFYKERIHDAGRPLSARELVDDLLASRGFGVTSEIPPIPQNHGVVRLYGTGWDAFYWDSELGDPPVS